MTKKEQCQFIDNAILRMLSEPAEGEPEDTSSIELVSDADAAKDKSANLRNKLDQSEAKP